MSQIAHITIAGNGKITHYFFSLSLNALLRDTAGIPMKGCVSGMAGSFGHPPPLLQIHWPQPAGQGAACEAY